MAGKVDKPRGIRPISASRKVAMLLYGNPGSGKTRLIGSGPAKTLILRPPMDHTDSIRVEGADEWVMKDWDDMTQAHEFLRMEDGGGYDWVWLDSISLFQDVGLDDIWQQVLDEKPSRGRYGLDKAEYGVNMFRLGQWVRHMAGLSDAGYFNFGITAHPRELTPTEDDTAADVLMPFIQGKNMAPKICGYMNVVAFLEVRKNEKRVLRTSATEKFYAKDQFDAFPDGRLPDPTMAKIITAIEQARPDAASKTARRRTRRTATKGATKA